MDSSNELAYLAGVFDGEGSFGIWSRGKERSPGFRASVEMTDADVIMKFLVNNFFNLNGSYVQYILVKPAKLGEDFWKK